MDLFASAIAFLRGLSNLQAILLGVCAAVALMRAGWVVRKLSDADYAAEAEDHYMDGSYVDEHHNY